MRDIRNAVRRAPWGYKRYYAPLPVLSVLILTTALAAPNILRTKFLIFQDPGTTIIASVQNVVHVSGPTGKIVGIATVTNTRPFPIQILALSAMLARVGPPGLSPITLVINITNSRFPIDIPAGGKQNIEFSGPFSGDLTTLASEQTFSVTPKLLWIEMPPSGTTGPFDYTVAKTCTIPSAIETMPTDGEWSVLCH